MNKLEIGQKVDKLLFLEDLGKDANGKFLLKFVCDCGNIRIAEKRVILNAIKNGHKLSCNIDKCNSRYLDLDDQKFGKLLVLKSDLPNRKILVKCDCGLEFETDKTSVHTGNVTSCGAGLCHPHTKNLTGMRFGFLIPQEIISTRASRENKSGGTIWKCKCDCGNTCDVLSSSLIIGQTKSCGCKTGFFYSEKATLPNCKAIINAIFASYENHAKKLNLNFLLSREEFELLIQTNCHYCGGELSNIRKLKNLTGATEFRYNGIDRKNSAGDYILENCVASCKDCNYAKRKLTYDEFIALCKRIANRF